MEFILSAINQHRASDKYKIASDAQNYAEGRNSTIMNYQKLLNTLSGEMVPDVWTANHKCASGFFKRFITQEVAYLLGNGTNFQNENTKELLGKDFDTIIYKGAKSALVQSVSFGFYNNDHVEMFDFLEFVPLYDEENGALMAGIRFWQIDNTKPLRATLYEIDGYTEYIKRKNNDMEVLTPKQSYRKIIVSNEFDGSRIYDGGNYDTFPIVPLWANPEKQSELVGKREQIDCYDLIKSGFANDLDDASMIYWTLENCGGMDDMDLAKFIERMHIVKAAVMNDEGAKAEAHTIDVPYQSRETYLTRLEKDLYKDFMALDVEQIAAGNVTATQINAAYEPLNEKTDEFELCVIEFLNGILAIAGIDDTPSFVRSKISNQTEEVQTTLSLASQFDDEFIVTRICNILGCPEEAENVLKRKDAEESVLTDFTNDIEEELSEEKAEEVQE